MGATEPWGQPPETKTSQRRKPAFLIMLAALLITVLIQKLFMEGSLSGSKLSPKERKKLEKRLREIDASEQYALIAIEDGWYPCLHSGRTQCFLKKGEVWKYGVTSKGRFGRYSIEFLSQNQVDYKVEYIGPNSECQKREIIKLYNYRNLPENLARPEKDRLRLPPYNSKKQ